MNPRILLLVFLAPAAQAAVHLDRLSLPDGFRIAVVTDQVPNARQLAEGPTGMLFAGTRRSGKLYAFDGTSVTVIDKKLTMPSGIAIIGNDLYVGALNRILRYPSIESRYDSIREPEVVTDSLPNKRYHGWKYLTVGPDGFLYANVGAPCNICRSDDERFASIVRVDPATGAATVFAAGIRNTVGMAFHPQTDHLWFTDNGRDLLGDDVPAEEINVASRPGLHFGYPHIHAGDIPDPKFGDDDGKVTFTPPLLKIQAHSAALGIDFYTGQQFPARYANALFVAEHGSWNRSSKVGYRVTVIRFQDDELVYEPFVTGWLEGEKNWGRPNDVLASSDGSLLISDDQAGAIYRVTYAP